MATVNEEKVKKSRKQNFSASEIALDRKNGEHVCSPKQIYEHNNKPEEEQSVESDGGRDKCRRSRKPVGARSER